MKFTIEQKTKDPAFLVTTEEVEGVTKFCFDGQVKIWFDTSGDTTTSSLSDLTQLLNIAGYRLFRHV